MKWLVVNTKLGNVTVKGDGYEYVITPQGTQVDDKHVEEILRNNPYISYVHGGNPFVARTVSGVN